jgi:hypothetical protein
VFQACFSRWTSAWRPSCCCWVSIR